MNPMERGLKRSARLFKLANLLQHERGITLKALSGKFKVSERTLYRDFRALAELGYEVRPTGKSGYELPGMYKLVTLRFTRAEATALVLGAKFAGSHLGEDEAKAANEAVRRIESELKPSDQEALRLRKETTLLDPGSTTGRTELETYAEIAQAIAEQHAIWIRYFVRSRQEETERTVEPLCLIFYTDHWNMLAYDRMRSDIRQFTLGYITDLDVLRMQAIQDRGFSVKQYFQDRGGQTQVVLRFKKSEYPRAPRHLPAPAHETDDGEFLVVSFKFDNLEYLAKYMLRFGADAAVVAPDELRERVHALAQRVTAQYAP